MITEVDTYCYHKVDYSSIASTKSGSMNMDRADPGLRPESEQLSRPARNLTLNCHRCLPTPANTHPLPLALAVTFALRPWSLTRKTTLYSMTNPYSRFGSLQAARNDLQSGSTQLVASENFKRCHSDTYIECTSVRVFGGLGAA